MIHTIVQEQSAALWHVHEPTSMHLLSFLQAAIVHAHTWHVVHAWVNSKRCWGLRGLLLCVMCGRRQAITLPEAGDQEGQLLVQDLDIAFLHAGSGWPSDNSVTACPLC